MAVTPSTMLPLGTQLPAFRLPNIDGNMVSPDDLKDAPALLVMIICNHCPYVRHVRRGIAQLARDLQKQGVAVLAINPNDPAAYPEDSPEGMMREASEVGYTFPYLFDETQEVAHAFHAACTPEFYLFNRERRLVYRGQMDDARPGNTIPVTGQDIRRAVGALVEGRPISEEQKPSVGCSIKWRPGNEPGY